MRNKWSKSQELLIEKVIKQMNICRLFPRWNKSFGDDRFGPHQCRGILKEMDQTLSAKVLKMANWPTTAEERLGK